MKVLTSLVKLNPQKKSSMNPFDAIAFDFDGVILDTEVIKTEGFQVIYPELGAEEKAFIADYHREHLGVSRFTKFAFFEQHFFQRELTLQRREELSQRFTDYTFQKVVEADFIPGVMEFLERQTSHIKFTASGSWQKELVEILDQRQISQYFQEIGGSPRTKVEIINETIAKYQLKPERVVMLGDAMADYDAAHQTGIAFIGICYQKDSPFVEGTKVLEDLRELHQFV